MKPRRNPGHVAFPRSGPPRFVTEELPRKQPDLELAIGSKFVASLERFHGIHLDGIAKAGQEDEPADLVCRLAGEGPLGMQVVEAVDDSSRQLQQMRSTYRDAIERNLRREEGVFSGCTVTLVDEAVPPFLPPVDSDRGTECLRILTDQIRVVASKASGLPTGRPRSWTVCTHSPKRTIGIIVERIVAAGLDAPCRLRWSGSAFICRDPSKSAVVSAVRGKIEKRYDKPARRDFWLLAYSVEWPLGEDDPDIMEVRRILEQSAHPFDQVWYFFPYAGEALGWPVKLWSSA
jgi:hypothetical protein